MKLLMYQRTPNILINHGCMTQWIVHSSKLPYPKLRQPTDTHISQRTLRATQVRSALARAYTVLLQSRPLRHPL
jgi:hypothetical protein